MKREEIYKSLLEILKNSLENPIDFTKIDETTKVYPDLLPNSITMMYVALAIEDHFGVSLMDADFSKLNTVGDILNYILERAK
ncbi:MAG: phosphopantetheine-binding protein [Erysipelotrichaceae bacterium]|nr:phosphopantetheine-binding protein [Erysipelotrichaceae bacterium]